MEREKIIGNKLGYSQDGRYFFNCPGCKCLHFFVESGPVRWTWNQDPVNVTVTPSILVDKDEPTRRCHLFLTHGKIHYCQDSAHELAGKIVDIPEW